MLRDLVTYSLLCLLMFFPLEGADDSSPVKASIVIPNRIFPPGYSAAVQPNFSGNTTVIGHIDVAEIDHISEKEKAFTIKANLTLFWNDTRLVVGSEEKSLEASEIRQLWIPHITVKNLILQSHNPQPLDRDHMTVFDTHVLVLPGGRIRLERAINARLSMNLRLWKYPNDEQWCNIILEIDRHRSRAVDLRLQKSNRKKQDITAPGTFDVHDYKLKKQNNCVLVSLGVTRVMSHQHLQLYLPCYLIVLLSWIPVYMPYRRNTRIKLSFSAVLTMMTFAAGFRSTLPKTKHIKLIDVYLLFSRTVSVTFLAVCIITVWFSLLSVLMLTWIKKKIFCCLICFTCSKDDPKDAVGADKKRHHKRRHENDDEFDDDDSDEETYVMTKCNPATEKLELLCRFPIKLVFLLIYIAPVLFITGAVLYHRKLGIHHLHKLSVKQ